MNNSVYGKTMENIRKRINVKIASTMEQKNKFIKNPLLTSYKLWGKDQDYGFFQFSKKNVVLNKPIQVGACILELSKVIMYNFHYNYIIPKYGNNQKLLFTDTDSLCYEIKGSDIFDDMIKDSHLFDLSDFKKDHKCYDPTNLKEPGKFKLETLDHIATEFIGLRSKLYSIKFDDDVEKKTCKGINKCVKENKITHDHYKKVLFNSINHSEKQNTFRSYNHDVYTIEVQKTALSAFNDKKYLLDDGINGYSFGHYKIHELNQQKN